MHMKMYVNQVFQVHCLSLFTEERAATDSVTQANGASTDEISELPTNEGELNYHVPGDLQISFDCPYRRESYIGRPV